MKRSAATFIASCLLLAACGGDDGPAKKKSDWDAPEFERVADAPVAWGVTYAEVPLDFRHVNGAAGKKFLPETMGSGVALIDYDGDGDNDLLFAQSRHWEAPEQPTMKLYRNDGGWTFVDVTKETGLALVRYGMGLSVADYDADGDPDVYLTCLGPNVLLRNEGGKRFVAVDGAPDGGTWTDDEGNEHPSWSTGAAWFDADADGDLDLFVVSYVHWTPAIDIHVAYVENIKAYARPQLYQGDQPRLYLQQDDGSFTDATKGSGFDKTAVAGKSLAICLDDFDGDGRTDVFVANDTVQNFLFLNRGDAKFEESAVAAAVAYDDNGRARAAMGVDAVDFRNDGKLSIAIGNFSEEPVSLYTVSRAGTDGVLFADDASAARIGQPTLLPLTFGLVMQDFDLDGWCDLLMANGHIEPSMPKLKPELQFEQAPLLFKNIDGERFADVTLDAGSAMQKRIVGRGLAVGDLDGDGDLDLVFTNNNGPPLVLRADDKTGHKSLRLRLRQPGKNRDALGAVVRVKAGGLTMRRVVRTGGSYLSQGEFTLTFGLGKAARADEITVRWPDGKEQKFGAKKAGAHVLERK